MLHYEVYRNYNVSQWVVFVHGIGGSTKTWKRQIDCFQKYFNLLLLDLPGHGESQEVAHKINHPLVNQDIRETLDLLDIREAHFIGMSLGTLVIMSFAAAYPEYVKSMVLGGAIISPQGIYRKLMDIAVVIKEFLPKAGTYKLFANIVMPARWHHKSRKIFFRECDKLSRPNLLAWIDYLANASKHREIVSRIKKNNTPTLFISGEYDNCFIRGVRKCSEALSKAKLIILSKCGHVCTIEQHHQFNELALNYLQLQ